MKAAVRSCCTLLFSLLVLSAPAWAAKIKVCHVPPDNPANFHTITINETALQSHLGHGDLVGECSAYCSQLCDDGNACTIDACDATEHCAATHPPVNCNDGNLCTDDTCNPAIGCFSTPRTCLDNDLCSVDSCDPLTGQCVFPPVACDAGQTCNPANGNCEGQATCPCAAYSEWDTVLAGAHPTCNVIGTYLLFGSDTGSATASSSGSCAAFQAGKAPIQLFNLTPEEGAACVELLSMYCPPER